MAQLRWRSRLLAGCALLVGIAFLQSPGYLIADTKFDLVEAPGSFLMRALDMWDPDAAFGQLQNQAYGYLWPMGPFFLLGEVVGLDGWVVQRLWMSLVLVTAFLGAALVCRALGVRSDFACLAAAFAYATSPRLLSTLGPISIEAWPSAVAPWVLLPLVLGLTRVHPWRAAGLAGLAVGMVGGVNAVATFAVIPVGAAWLLTRPVSRRRNVLLFGWSLATLLATGWWLVPLLLLGTYSPPFLAFIESASITTFPTTLTDALRGTSAWVPYIDSSWVGGHLTVTQGYLALNSAVVLSLGLVGIVVAPYRLRVFLVVTLVLGLVLVTAGHTGAVEGVLAGSVHTWLDGALAPLRNLHKFDPVVRLPMVVGLALVLERAHWPAARESPTRLSPHPRTWARTGLVFLSLVAIAGAAAPAITGRLAPAAAVIETPDYWSDAAEWLGQNSAPGETALLAPGSGFADYLWGAPRDEPLQYLAESPWAVRNAIPLAPPGNIRWLDAVEGLLSEGEPSEALAGTLRRAGVAYLVVRNDLVVDSDVPEPVLVHQAIEGSPGVRRVASFGPDLGGAAVVTDDDRRIVSGWGWREERPAIEVYGIDGTIAVVEAGEPPVVVGGPEDLHDLRGAGLLGDTPAVLGVDAEGTPPASYMLTDGFIRRERFFGRVHDSQSHPLLAGEPRRSKNPTLDYLPPAAGRWQSRARLLGAETVHASSSISDAVTPGGARAASSPYAAIDGLFGTEWVSRDGEAGTPWWRVQLASPRFVDAVEVTVGPSARDRVQIRAVTDKGGSDTVEAAPGSTRVLQVPAGATSSIRIEIASGSPAMLALAEVSWGAGEVRRQLVTPQMPDTWPAPDAILLRTLLDHRTGCVVVGLRTPCREGEDFGHEEPKGLDRWIHVPRAASYVAEATGRPVFGPELSSLLQQGQPINVSESSHAVEDPRSSGLAAIDGDIGTSWTARLDDLSPELRINWLGTRSLSSIEVVVEEAAPVRRPVTVELLHDDGSQQLQLDSGGRADLGDVETDSLVLRVLDAEAAGSAGRDGFVSELPVGISELRINGVPFEPVDLSDQQRTWACGTGPDVQIGDSVRGTAVRASPRQLYDLDRVDLRWCTSMEDGRQVRSREEVDLVAGGQTVVALSDGPVVVDELRLRRPDAALGQAPAADAVSGVKWRSRGRSDFSITPSRSSGIIVMRQNHNDGWRATQGGAALEPLVVDGWQQAWRLSSDEVVTVRYAPGRTYRWALMLGLSALVLLAVSLCVAPIRRRLRSLSGPPTRAADGALGSTPADAGRGLPATTVIVIAWGVGAVLAGWAGALIASVVFAVARLAARRGRAELVAYVVAGASGLAVAIYAVRPWGSSAGWAGSLSWPHYLVIVALSGLASTLVRGVGDDRSPMAGRSTRR
ncbi:alpha-(1-_3)-arabinofuranosyltransferase domain-containing protein [Nocardioides coralli]|uniref:alpha-(1->3)-arabinofuranosyltransferase domain-containing protein n=1 Tax=Nocardioides coralli TaxID=2872154 RepID=UPI001CA4669E|nr:alpha-(1->3)-arabinofuranosyltransferase family protein [Nocardioides coralli]QZY27902.1 DUF3367 domain-containing protein [Nocardioides coralli]